MRLKLDEVKDIILNGLDAGFSTESICGEIGVQYESVLQRLRENDEDELLMRLRNLRMEEWNKRRFINKMYERKRCIHGAWTSSGDCEHGKLGRYAKEAA